MVGDYYYGTGRFQKIHFGFSFSQDWERYFGSLLSMAGMPDEDHPKFGRLQRAAREVFEQFSKNGRMEMQGFTELFIGQVSGVS